jgi:hypothetical protein
LKETKGEFTRRLDINAAWDKRDPDPSKNCGVHGVEFRWYLIGQDGAVQFVLYTNWQLPDVAEGMVCEPKGTRGGIFSDFAWCPNKPLPADLGYHSPVPMYKGQQRRTCEILPQGYCFYDGSVLAADRVFTVLREAGEEGLWATLEQYYVETFEQEVEE